MEKKIKKVMTGRDVGFLIEEKLNPIRQDLVAAQITGSIMLFEKAISKIITEEESQEALQQTTTKAYLSLKSLQQNLSKCLNLMKEVNDIINAELKNAKKLENS